MGADRRDCGDGRRHGFHQSRAQDRPDRRRRDRARAGYALQAAKEWRVVSLLAPFAPDFHTHVIFARDEFIAKKPELVERFLRGWFETIAWRVPTRSARSKSPPGCSILTRR